MSKIDPKNQIIHYKGKVVNFDDLPLHIQEKLLTSWKIKTKKANGNKGDKTKTKASEQRAGEAKGDKTKTKKSS